ncbi:hypothetical protein FNV43_RR06266 [Rhamnella rubrinervis]|uniref:ribose-5-phosphate isomerase n=1 Tax=Rhamnella rubrinervis TaxID=2594499 RepID=A0A8K0ML50_9ROSA|nr:hypothetical protein FNV43_RR06266 [Rhamnella rubrinervis]
MMRPFALASMAAASSSSSPPLACSSTSLHCSATSSNRRRSTQCLRITASSSLADASALLQAAHHTVDTYVKSGMVIGLGSGQASAMAIEYLGRQLRVGAFRDVVGIPTCVASASEAAKAGIPLDYYHDSSQIDFAFDDADIMEEGTLTAVIGRQSLQGDESIIQQKCILNAADKLVFMITKNKYRGGLDGSIPVLVQSLNWLETAEEIDDLFLGDAEVWRRAAIGQAGPMGGDFPLVTKEGYNVLDIIFTSPIQSLGEVAKSLDNIDGVVDHGVISKFPCTAVIGLEGGLCIVDSQGKSSVEGL